MTNEELNTQLYQKMFAEQEKYRDWLLTLAPEEILNHTYECFQLGKHTVERVCSGLSPLRRDRLWC